MKIPTVTREAIDAVVRGEKAGYIDSKLFEQSQPELMAFADRVFGPCHLKAAYLSGMTMALRCLEEMKEPN